jgi:competence protein ComEC
MAGCGLDLGDQLAFIAISAGRILRNPGVRSFDTWLEDQDLDAVGVIKNPLFIERIAAGRNRPLLGAIYRFRATAISTLLTRISLPTSGLLVAALFGNRYFIDRRLGESFRAGGTFHLLVISGLHIALIAALLLWITTRIIHSRLLQYLLVFIVTWLYVLMVGAQPSVTRAGWMMSMALIGRLIFRPTAGPNALAAAAFTLLLWRPRELLNPSFQLSFLTVAMIVFISAPVYRRLKSIGEWRPPSRRLIRRACRRRSNIWPKFSLG